MIAEFPIEELFKMISYNSPGLNFYRNRFHIMIPTKKWQEEHNKP